MAWNCDQWTHQHTYCAVHVCTELVASRQIGDCLKSSLIDMTNMSCESSNLIQRELSFQSVIMCSSCCEKTPNQNMRTMEYILLVANNYSSRRQEEFIY